MVVDSTQAIAIRPEFAAAFAQRGAAHSKLQQFAEALADFRAAVTLEPQEPSFNNALAWLLATCPDADIRNGADAVIHASKACELTGQAVMGYCDTLAAAHAEAGQFEQAVTLQELVLTNIPADEQADYQHRLQLYQAHQPYREPVPTL